MSHHNRQLRRDVRGLTRHAEKGMTLLEIMIVVAILGLLATVVASNLMGALDNAKIQTTQLKISEIGSTVNQYYTMVGDYPDSMNDLVSPPGGLKPFFKSAPKDPWNKEFVYKRTSGEESFVVYSLGPDKAKGTSDDIYAKGTKK